ncbi:MAG: hypothetical protein GY759_23320 [Chloroflexi bacterium]|nr:hypothetical protein [Chloroflexota bacterium]
MAKENNSFISFLTNKKIYYIFLFTYFGFMIIPQWFRPFSTQFMVWIIALPIILLILVVIGVWGILGIRRAKANNHSPEPMHKFFIRIASTGLLWFGISVALTSCTSYLYNHQEFNSEVWRSSNSASYVPHDLTSRQKMLDDVIKNILPGSTQDELEVLLGESADTGLPWTTSYDLIFLLGPDRGLFGIDSEWLLIWVDENGYFDRYEIFTD